jgi:uncharacterized protein YjbI with pentapeptide repeats
MDEFDMKGKDKEYRALALQRKEENKIFYAQFLEEFTSGQDFKKELIEGNGVDYITLDRTLYHFSNFNNVVIGKEKSDGEACIQEGVKFYYCEFQLCAFNNVEFRNCNFVGCSFIDCYSMGSGMIFHQCSFMRSTKGKNNIDDMPVIFEGSDITAIFEKCDMSNIISIKTHFYNTKFIETSLYDAIFLDSGFDIVRICDCDLRSTKVVGPKWNDFTFEDEHKTTKVNENTFFGMAMFSKKEKMEVDSAVEAYRSLGKLMEKNDVVAQSSEYFYLFKKIERHRLKGVRKLISLISYLICGYGERPFFSLIAAVAVVLICGTLFMVFGVSVNNETLFFHPSMGKWLPPSENLVYWYHFSLVTFTTVGYGNVVPVGGSIFVSGAEMVLGVILTGIWISTLVRKMTR